MSKKRSSKNPKKGVKTTLLKKRSWNMCFPVNFAKFF